MRNMKEYTREEKNSKNGSANAVNILTKMTTYTINKTRGEVLHSGPRWNN